MTETLSDAGVFAGKNPDGEDVLCRRLRILQIRLSAEAIRNTALSEPVWAIMLMAVFGGLVPELGHIAPTRTWPWLGLCMGVALALALFSSIVKKRAKNDSLEGRYWLPLVAAGYFILSLSWCLSTVIFWIPGNTLNHCFLLAVAIASASLFLTSRSGKFGMVVAATVPNLGLIWLQFLRQEIWFDSVMAVMLPVWAVQLHIDSWRACGTVTAAHRTKLEMEALATQLSEARDEASAANRSKSQFLANMSHELRTPLNAIIGFSEVISTDALGAAAKDRYRDYAADILRSGRHLLGLINDILDLAKIEAGKLELERTWLDGAAMMRDCVKLFAEAAYKKGQTLRTCTAEDVRLFADERAARQIVINLLSNAAKFTPSGGTIDADLIASEKGVVIRIRDTGCGVPAEQLSRIFQPFEQADNRYGRATGGTGLGLTLVRALCELHGGHCAIESTVGRGTCVSVFLPLADAPHDEAAPITATQAA